MPEFAPGLHAAAGKAVDVAAYERFTGYWSRLFVPQVIAAAAIGPGSKVLDISTGTGEAALAILPAIGDSGLLVGADISPEMLDGARRRVRNHPNDPAILSIAGRGGQAGRPRGGRYQIGAVYARW